MTGRDERRRGGRSADDEPGDDQPAWKSDCDDRRDEIALYALGIYAFAFLFVAPPMNDFIQAHFGRWVVVVAGFALLVGWGVALVGLVMGRRWGWVGSLCFRGFGALPVVAVAVVASTAASTSIGSSTNDNCSSCLRIASKYARLSGPWWRCL